MQRPTSLVLLCLAAFLVLFPLTLVKPGWPAGLKADEPAYYLMALSLAHDFDLRCDLGDLRRLFDEFPDHPTRNLILMTDDGWHTVWFGKPYLFSLLAAPLAALFGANGPVALNMALLVGMIALGSRYLERFNSGGTALLFASGFFVLSAAFAYVFWVQPEVFNMAAITVCLYLGLTEPGGDGSLRRGLPGWLGRPLWRALLSGAALSLAVYNKPMLAAMGLPVVFALARGRRLRELGAWLAGGALALAAAAGGAMAFTGHPSAYLGVARAGVKVCSPHEMPIQPLPPPPPSAAPEEAPERGSLADESRASWLWLLHLPVLDPPWLFDNARYFLWGRHTGLFLYFPFSLLALGLFLVHGRRSAVRWALAGSIAAVALFFLLWIPFNWHGGGGFVGNRYFVNVYPGLLFLVTRIAPGWIHLVGYAAGGLLLGPTIFSPMGRVVPFPTMQAHVRNFPYPLFPLELGVKGIPGYHETTLAGARFRGRQDVFLPRGPAVWVGGAASTEVWIFSPEPLPELVLRIASFAAPNQVELELAGARERLDFAAGEAEQRRQVTLEPAGPTRTLSRDGAEAFYYRLEVRAASGEVREWTQHYPPRDCFYYPYMETSVESFYAGAELTYLGTAERLERDLYALAWGRVDAPERVSAGAAFTVYTRVRNASRETWPADPPTRVNLSYHWEDAEGREVVRNGLRTFLERPVPPGARVAVEQTVEAPAEPGRYVLALDLVYEEVAWFSSRNGGDVRRLKVDVVP
jgi:hypothetical protein